MKHKILPLNQMEPVAQKSIKRFKSLSRRLLMTQENEKRLLVRRLHDELSQTITGLRLTLGAVAAEADENIKEQLVASVAVLDALVETTRNLSMELRPPMLDDLGLLSTLSWYCQHYFAKTGVVVEFVHDGIEGRFPPDVETSAYRIVQQALDNVARHAGSNDVVVCVSANRKNVHIEVSDQGKGFDADRVLRLHPTSGLSEMSERAALLNGRLAVNSIIGRGTSIVAALPLNQPPESLSD